MNLENTIKVQLFRSLIGVRQSHKDIVRGLGLRKINSIKELQDTAAIRGMADKVSYLVRMV